MVINGIFPSKLRLSLFDARQRLIAKLYSFAKPLNLSNFFAIVRVVWRGCSERQFIFKSIYFF